MPRRTPSTRVTDIARAACTVFTAKGYRQTLMTDVGRELGLSHALLYQHVESKEALFQLALLYACDPGAVARVATPVRTPGAGEVLRPLADWASRRSGFPVLQAAVNEDGPRAIRREFHDVVDELYSMIEDNRAVLALIERCAPEFPGLGALYFDDARRGQVDQLEQYLRSRMRSGLLRPAPDPALAMQFMVETVAWFAWHRRDHPGVAAVDDGAARDTVHYLLAAAFVPDDTRDDTPDSSPAGG